ncbi:hypothetical protein C8J56DRAFT_903927 [Mycena floridula]|nr:hypothetical protein C8J56DRAFT_903927 [Mycena floridula]
MVLRLPASLLLLALTLESLWSLRNTSCSCCGIHLRFLEILGKGCRHCQSQNRALFSHKLWLGDFDAVRTELHFITASNVKALADRMPVLERVRARLVVLDRLVQDCLDEYEELRTQWLKLFVDYVHTPGGPQALSIIPRAHYETILKPLFTEAGLEIVNEKMLLAYSGVWIEGQGFPESSRDGVDRLPIILSSEASADPPADAMRFKIPPSYAAMAAAASEALAKAAAAKSSSIAQGPVAKAPVKASLKPKPSGSKSVRAAKTAVPAVVESEDESSDGSSSAEESPPARVTRRQAVVESEDEASNGSSSAEEPPPARVTRRKAKRPIIEDEESEEEGPPPKKRRVSSVKSRPAETEVSESNSEAAPPVKSKKTPANTAPAAASKTKTGKAADKRKPVTMESGDHSRRQKPQKNAGSSRKAKPQGR